VNWGWIVKRWLRVGAWQPRQAQRRARQLDRFAAFMERRAPAVGFNGAGLSLELVVGQFEIRRS
jgi:hypothetical protein